MSKQSKTILKELNAVEQLRYSAMVILTVCGKIKINKAYSNPEVRVKRHPASSPHIMTVTIVCRLQPIITFQVMRDYKCCVCSSNRMFDISKDLYRIFWHTAKIQAKEAKEQLTMKNIATLTKINGILTLNTKAQPVQIILI